MAEAVVHEVNGLLFKRDDSDDLAKQLRRILSEPELLDQLRAGIPKVKTIEEEVTELESNYADLIAQRGGCENQRTAKFNQRRKAEAL